MGPVGWPETVFIVILALLLFGPKKLPELGRMLGKAITEFRRASAELKSTFDREMKNLERETQAAKEVVDTHFQDTYNYDYSSYDSGSPYTPEAATAELPAPASPEAAPSNTAGASAVPGAESTPAAERPGISVTPAEGIVANGSLGQKITPQVVSDSAPLAVEQEAIKT